MQSNIRINYCDIVEPVCLGHGCRAVCEQRVSHLNQDPCLWQHGLLHKQSKIKWQSVGFVIPVIVVDIRAAVLWTRGVDSPPFCKLVEVTVWLLRKPVRSVQFQISSPKDTSDVPVWKSGTFCTQ